MASCWYWRSATKQFWRSVPCSSGLGSAQEVSWHLSSHQINFQTCLSVDFNWPPSRPHPSHSRLSRCRPSRELVICSSSSFSHQFPHPSFYLWVHLQRFFLWIRKIQEGLPTPEMNVFHWTKDIILIRLDPEDKKTWVNCRSELSLYH